MVRNIAGDVRRLIRRHLDVADACISLHASFTEDLGADSVGLVELTLALEEWFDIEIADEEATRIRTVDDAIRIVERHLGSSRGAPAS